MVTLPQARLERAADGTPFSSEFQDVYHSTGGGLAQARHVFLGGNRLPQRWAHRDAFVILETGFGLGLNFLAAWQAWREDAARPRRLHFISVEHRPLSREDLRDALSSFEPLQPLATQLLAHYPPPLAGFHRVHFERGAVMLTLLLGPAQELLPQLVARADAFFLDGFSPARNAAIWSPEVVRELARLAAPEATLATWTVAGGVRAALVDAGFRIEKAEGFAHKRQMLVGSASASTAASSAPERHCAVIGAGLAGTVLAERLALRGWHVDLVDARIEPSTAAVGVVRPVVNLRDAVNARISRSAFFYALQHYEALAADGLQWDRCGVLQLAGGEDEAARFEAIVRSQGYPAGLLQYVDAARAGEIAGHPVRGSGWWFPQGAWVAPDTLARASLARADTAVRRIAARAVHRLEREGRSWRALDEEGRVVAEAATVVLANAADAKRLLPEARLMLSSVRGQLTYLPPSPDRALRAIVSGTGYAVPLADGGQVIGATYQHDDADASVRAADHRDNLARAEAMLPGFTGGLHPMALGGWTGFRTTVSDRLPVFGASAIEGVHVATGLGSRGLLWAPLGAELLACRLEGEPLPLGRDHAGAISPLRFLS
jgi:tRNA 5-methylaminomethyl-2-thiouridine biosynthesis bifunctional protein